MIATPMASAAMSTVVSTTMLRKLRRRMLTRSASELAARTVVTILPRSLLIVLFAVLLRYSTFRHR